jgi:hypothetical protein
MTKVQLSVRIPPLVHEKLEDYIHLSGESKTEVVAKALAEYLERPEGRPLIQRMAELERQMKELKTLVKSGVGTREVHQ